MRDVQSLTLSFHEKYIDLLFVTTSWVETFGISQECDTDPPF
jgi:hypothetical protein